MHGGKIISSDNSNLDWFWSAGLGINSIDVDDASGPLQGGGNFNVTTTVSSEALFGIKGGFEAGVKFYDELKLIKRLVNIGDAKSLACHPASTTHRQMSEEEQLTAGVTPEALRLCIGIEHIDDIVADLEQAFAAA